MGSSPEAVSIDDAGLSADWESVRPEVLERPLSTDQCSDSYFRNREQLGLLTPAHSPDLMQRGSLYDPDQSGGSSSLSRPSGTLTSSSKPGHGTASTLGSHLSPNSGDPPAAGPISPTLPAALCVEIVSPPPRRQLDFW